MPKQKRSFEEACARQICRTWLKHTYLQIGAPCVDEACLRLHEISCRADSLYKDFSFKGLPQKHRKRILERVRDEQAAKKIIDS